VTWKRPVLVAGVIGFDPHNIGIKILQLALEEAGFQIVNLGIYNSQEDFIKASIETGAVGILVGSYYGHGEFDCRGFKEKCEEAGLGNVLLYIGGYLAVGKPQWKEVEAKFKSLGFDRVYPHTTLPQQVINDLRSDLTSRGVKIPDTSEVSASES
jgi:methylaspartate mutase sigma subunit